MLRLILQWFSKNRKPGYQISFDKDAHWFSEGRLATVFKNGKGLKIGENYTVADGIYGNIAIGTQGALHKEIKARGISDVRLVKDCRQFVAVEAKMYSNFSKGITNAKKYNQVARYLACMSNVVCQSGVDINKIKDLSFYTFLPDSKKNPTFCEYTRADHIKETVRKRMEDYDSQNSQSKTKEWFYNAFLPFMDKVKIKLITWEEILKHIEGVDNESYNMLSAFYLKCKRYNGSVPSDIMDTDLLA